MLHPPLINNYHPRVISDHQSLLPLNGFTHEKYKAEDLEGIIVSNEDIKNEIARFASALKKDYRNKDLHILWVADGARRFYEELLLAKDMPKHTSSWIKVESYTDQESNKRPEIVAGDIASAKDKRVLLLDDIGDTETTLNYLTDRLEDVGVRSLKKAVLFDKRRSDKKERTVHYPLISIPQLFGVGFGMDYNGEFRDLDDLYLMSDVGIEKYESKNLNSSETEKSV